MKNRIVNIVKVILPLLVGIYIIWHVFGQLAPDDQQALFLSLREAHYGWIAISIFFGILSHISRAYRWKYLLAPLGVRPRFLNSFFSVMIGYLINLILPRVGEVTRCGILSKYEKTSFSKLFGTVIAERIADMTILTTIMLVVIAAQLSTIRDLLVSILPDNFDLDHVLTVLAVSIAAIVLLTIAGYHLLKKSMNAAALKIKSVLVGFADGLKSIVNMRNSWRFVAHTFFIWLMYILMFYISFFSLAETSHVPLAGVLAAFVLGGLSLIFIQGGIGIYPAAIMKVLVLYGVDEGPGGALGWIIWSSQTAMLLTLGLLSIALVSWYNKKLIKNA